MLIVFILSILVLFILFSNYAAIRSILFLFNPESVHYFTFNFIKRITYFKVVKKFLSNIFVVDNKELNKEVFGIKFKNPVGLAAGFDKDAMLFDELSIFGFGFIEIGTITPVAQSGNSKPRLFRLSDDNALINRMGFNNHGLESAISRLRRKKSNIIIGGNIGKNKLTPNEKAIDDYEICFEKLFTYVDYFVVNVSSPNTPGLRELQEKKPLSKILARLQEINNKKDKRKPILLKISPDLTTTQLDIIIEIIIDLKIDGIIATNTTIDRTNLLTDKSKVEKIGAGGLSGKPLNDKSNSVIKYIKERSNGSFPIIGVGGINSAEDAIEKIDAGASLVQIYTGFIYKGPSLIKNINKAILNSEVNN
ncbi:MAG: dihydroorotate dehydrogenase (quinone) [Flavobacteriales bacterium]|nr:dihydroorotate dehydrogenase (quinone) [Flavobacteriales bacterium]|tara:strand:- start:491 stop:1582 length:1092 start_codon:yes stop_codon:yes gene_type:complete